MLEIDKLVVDYENLEVDYVCERFRMEEGIAAILLPLKRRAMKRRRDARYREKRKRRQRELIWQTAAPLAA